MLGATGAAGLFPPFLSRRERHTIMSPRSLRFAALFLTLAAAASPALGATGDWVRGQHIALRLIATPLVPGAPLEGVIEIVLDEGWKTYWRSPGDAGIPPRFDFSGSKNVGAAAIAFPAPQRDDDGISVSNVYHDRVLLPVTFGVNEGSQPAMLRLVADLGVCKDICLPVNLVASLDVPMGGPDAEDAVTIAAARAALPVAGQAGLFEVAGLKRVGGSDREPEFEARVVMKRGGEGLLFVETPTDWYPATPMVAKTDGLVDGERRYRFSVDRKTATTPLTGATIRLTLTENGAATSRAFTLDADAMAVPLPD